ncbi:wd40 protein [Reticulomyxa filosa]|uniref:Wd40 protein n=1 Tax=Reticulomyxa filosa TaxID=46433 RepID=X6NJQ1_RETFI|nr:wd40 protein [Reticulomyxa filosa]|eukprot:ETO26535.1 wd40 protein [Reticulomyxa filosa]
MRNNLLFKNKKSFYFSIAFFSNFALKISSENSIKIIIQNWIRILDNKLGWVKDFDQIVVKYVRQCFLTLEQFKYGMCNQGEKFAVSRGYNDFIDFTKFSSFEKTVNFLQPGKGVKKFEGNDCYISDVNFSLDGKYIVSGSTDGIIKLWDVNTMDMIQTLTDNSDRIDSVQFLPDGQYIVSSSLDNIIRIYNVDSGKEVIKNKKQIFCQNALRYTEEGDISVSKKKIQQVLFIMSFDSLKTLNAAFFNFLNKVK